MITWVTVWVLTVSYSYSGGASHYKLTYATQEICEKQRKQHENQYKASRCDFQQVPVYKGGK